MSASPPPNSDRRFAARSVRLAAALAAAIAAAHGTLDAELSLAVQLRRAGSGHGAGGQRRLHGVDSMLAVFVQILSECDLQVAATQLRHVSGSG